jgi:hypothetical protein
LANINCFSPIGKYRPDIRQLANILWRNKNILANFPMTLANWRIYYGKTKIYWRISSRHSPIGEYTVGKQKYIGEFPHDIRQLANILKQEQISFSMFNLVEHVPCVI